MEQYEAFKKVREAQAKGDLIGTIHNSEVYELLGFHKVAGDVPDNKRNDVEDRAKDFGNEREETGFRIGFHMAMRLCMEGMNGGVVV